MVKIHFVYNEQVNKYGYLYDMFFFYSKKSEIMFMSYWQLFYSFVNFDKNVCPYIFDIMHKEDDGYKSVRQQLSNTKKTKENLWSTHRLPQYVFFYIAPGLEKLCSVKQNSININSVETIKDLPSTLKTKTFKTEQKTITEKSSSCS